MNHSPQPAFTAERRQTLRAVVERILPGTDGPGAARTDVAVALERTLAQASFRGLRPALDAVLDQLQAQAGQLHAREFSACAPGQQDELLQALQRGEIHPWSRVVLRTLIVFSVEGLLGDPVHGGNRDFKGWEAVGLQPSHVRAGLCRDAGVA